MKKAVIFDLDGVIVSTDRYHYLAWKAIADEEGIEFNEKINNRLRGVSRLDSLNIILEKSSKTYSQEEKERLAAKKNSIYVESLKEMNENSLSNDVLSTLKTLKANGVKIAIGSSSKNTKFILKQIGILDMFDAIVDGSMISHSKPDPEVFLKAGELLGLDVKDCYVVEDAESGIESAKRGGFEAIGIGDAAKYFKTDIPIKKISDILSL